jgi:hypothetical protein
MRLIMGARASLPALSAASANQFELCAAKLAGKDARAPMYTHSQTALAQFMIAGAALRAALRVERAATGATVIHRAREPVCDERAQDENDDQNDDAQQGVDQLLYLSAKLS